MKPPPFCSGRWAWPAWFIRCCRGLKFLAAFTAPLLFTVGVFALMPALDPPHGPKPEFSGALRSLHAATILQAYGAFGLAAVAAAMFLGQQHDLKVHKLRALLSLLRPCNGWNWSPRGWPWWGSSC